MSVNAVSQNPAETALAANVKLSIVSKGRFTKVKDGRGRPIEGLWVRNGRYYCQISLPNRRQNGRPACKKVALVDEQDQPVKTVQQAKEAAEALRLKKREGEIANPGRAPFFPDHVEQYLGWIKQTGAKKEKTVAQEKCSLGAWVDHIGAVRINQISRQHVNSFILKRKKLGGSRRNVAGHSDRGAVGNRAVNLDVIVLNNCLNFAKQEGWLVGKLPTEGLKPLPYRAPKRKLFTKDQIEKVRLVALETKNDGSPKYRNGEMLADLLNLMRTSGARITSALATRWRDVDWKNRQLHLRKTKYGKRIIVDFNSELETVLVEMAARRCAEEDPEKDFMFPGTRTGENVGSLRKTFELVRASAGLSDLRCHDLRHSFASHCIMSGVDAMTVARWLGHEDGGVLIGKVYGHLSNEHAQRAAKKVSFDVSAKENQLPEAVGSDLEKYSPEQLLQALQNKYKANAK